MRNSFFDLITETDVGQNIQIKLTKKIKFILLEEFYRKFKDLLEVNALINSIQDKTIYNANFDLITKALIDNKIYYVNGIIKGEFNARLSSQLEDIGGIWNKKQQGFLVNIYNIPKTLLYIIQRKETQKKNVATFLVISVPNIIKTIQAKIEQINLEKDFNTLINEVKSKLSKNEVIKSTNLIDSEEYKNKYNNNMQLSIKGMAEQQITKLRNDTLEILETGGSQKDLKKLLSHNYVTTKNRAEFIANEEIRLALTSYQEEKFAKEGLSKFYWVHSDPRGETSRAEHVEFFKQSNEGKIFDYNNLPINRKTNKPDAPGRLYRCRCIARMIIDNKK